LDRRYPLRLYQSNFSERNFWMSNRVRVEIVGRNQFWRNAVFVEWEYQFPERKIEPEGARYHLIEEDWLEDLQRVAAQCFSRALLAPQDPGRRRLFRKIFAREEEGT
jgi:hypothetical protein